MLHVSHAKRIRITTDRLHLTEPSHGRSQSTRFTADDAGDAVGGVVVGSAHGRVGTIATPPVDGDNSEDPLILPLTPGWLAWRIAGTAAAAIQAAAIDGEYDRQIL